MIFRRIRNKFFFEASLVTCDVRKMEQISTAVEECFFSLYIRKEMPSDGLYPFKYKGTLKIRGDVLSFYQQKRKKKGKHR